MQASIKAPTPAAETISDTVTVPLKYHHFISQQGNFFRNLRSFGVNVEQSATPSKSAVPARPVSEAAASARIDSDEAEVKGVEWQVIANYQDAEDGDSVWTLKDSVTTITTPSSKQRDTVSRTEQLHHFWELGEETRRQTRRRISNSPHTRVTF